MRIESLPQARGGLGDAGDRRTLSQLFPETSASARCRAPVAPRRRERTVPVLSVAFGMQEQPADICRMTHRVNSLDLA
eukprot:s10141_g1.t1